MCVNHRSADICVAEELLDCPDVIPVFQEVSGKRMAKRVRARRLGYPGLLCLHHPVEHDVHVLRADLDRILFVFAQ